MKRLGMCAVVVLALAISVPALATGMAEETVFYSDALGAERTALVYLPDGYADSGQSYPVIYFLAMFGGGGPGNWVTPDAGYHAVLDEMIGNGLIDPLIFVEVDPLTTPWAPDLPVGVPAFMVDSELNGNHETSMVEDLVPWIDSNYRTLADREHRYVQGASAGGFGAARLALKHWDIFGGFLSQVGSISMELIAGAIPLILSEYPDGPPYEWNPMAGTWSMYLFSWCAALTPNITNPPWYVDMLMDQDGNLDQDQWQRFLAHSNSRWAAEMAAAGGELDIFMDGGDQDFYLPFTLYFAGTLDALGLPYTLQMFHRDHGENPPWYERFRSHLTYFMPLNATAELSPRVIDRNYWWPLVHATIELPGDLDVAEIETTTLAITGINGDDLDHPIRALVASEISDLNGNGRDDLNVWFWNPLLVRAAVAMGISEGEPFDVTIEGETSQGWFLAATDEQTAVNMARPEATVPFWPFAVR